MNMAIVGRPSIMFKRHAEVGLTIACWLDLMTIHFTPGPWHRTCPSTPARSGASRTMPWMLRACPMAMGHAIAGPPSNGWARIWKSVRWRACCTPPTGPRCDWACGTCPWTAIIRTLPWCSSSMAACFTVTTAASSRMPGSALLPRRGGSTSKGTKTTWGSLVTTRSWPSGSASGRPSSAPTPAQRRVSMDVSQPPMAGSHLPAPGTDMQALLWAICEDFSLFGLTQVDIHIPEGLKDKFRDLPPIYKSFSVSKEDAGPHMAQFCVDTGVVSQPWWSLIVSYFGDQVLIPTPLLRWYLLNGLVVTCLYLQMQYDRHQCFQSLAEACAQEQWDAQRDPLQALAGESVKLLMTSVYGKCSENKTRFMQTYFVKGPVDSKAVASNRFRDMRPLLAIPLPEVTHSARALPEMDPEDMTEDSGEPEGDGDEDDAPEAVPADHYQLAMAPERLTMDLLVQITVFGYTYAKLRMLQLQYDLLGEYADHRWWELLYMDTDSYYVSLGGNSLHDCLRPECLLWVLSWMVPQRGLWCAQGRVRGHHDTPGAPQGYLTWQCCEARWLYDEKTPGLFKTEWCGDGMVALCSKTYYCRDAEGHDKLSSKGLQKNADSNALIYEAYRRVLATGSLSGGMNRCIQTGPAGTYTPTGRSSASNGRSPTRSMRIELAVSELEINVRRSMCELENMGIGRIGSLKQSLKPKIRCVYTKTNPCYRPANGLVPDMASILCMFSVRTPADSTDGDREFPQYIVFYRRG